MLYPIFWRCGFSISPFIFQLKELSTFSVKSIETIESKSNEPVEGIISMVALKNESIIQYFILANYNNV